MIKGHQDPEVLSRRKGVAKLMNKGFNGAQIERKLGIQPSVVYADIKLINKASDPEVEEVTAAPRVMMFPGVI